MGLKNFFNGNRAQGTKVTQHVASNQVPRILDNDGQTHVMTRAETAAMLNTSAAERLQDMMTSVYSPKAVRYECNRLFSLDCSSSMHDAEEKVIAGTRALLKVLRRRAKETGYIYNVCFTKFGSEYEVLLPFTNLDDIPDDFTPNYSTGGVTRMDEAIRKNFELIDEQKRKQDEEKRPRLDSSVSSFTDGENTDAEGYPCPLSTETIMEIAMRAETRKTSSLAFGFGSVNEEMLSQLAPGTVLNYADGKAFRNKQAVVCQDLDISSLESEFEALFSLIGAASSSSGFGPNGQTLGAEPVMVVEGDEIPEGFTDVIELPRNCKLV